MSLVSFVMVFLAVVSCRSMHILVYVLYNEWTKCKNTRKLHVIDVYVYYYVSLCSMEACLWNRPTRYRRWLRGIQMIMHRFEHFYIKPGVVRICVFPFMHSFTWWLCKKSSSVPEKYPSHPTMTTQSAWFLCAFIGTDWLRVKRIQHYLWELVQWIW